MRCGRKESSEWIMRSLALPRIGGNDMEENLSRKTIVRFVQSLDQFDPVTANIGNLSR